MIEVREVPLQNLVLPSSQIGLVVAQPFLELDGSAEPFKWKGAKIKNQLDAIRKTLEIAKACDHGSEKTHFTIFPEYSIPGKEGINLIEELMRDNQWPSGTVVTAGIDGMTGNEYQSICEENNTEVHPENQVTSTQNDWINSCITWVKSSDQTIRRWIQLKFCPAWEERSIQHSSMRPGHGIFLFRAKFDNEIECQFINLICFDWIGRIGSLYGIEAILTSLSSFYVSGTTRKIHFVFLLQRNDQPNHRNFLENVNWFFEKRDRCPLVDRADSIIVYANSASVPDVKNHNSLYGFSALISSPGGPYTSDACPPTYALKTSKRRGNQLLVRPVDVLFRENTACIHSLSLRIPQFIGRGSADRCLPLEVASVHSTDGSVSDPRLPGQPVPAVVKWTNDALDSLPHLLKNQPEHPMRHQAEQSHAALVNEIRWMESKDLQRFILLCSADSAPSRAPTMWINNQRQPNIDNWDATEASALETVLQALTVLKSARNLSIQDSSAHGILVIDDKLIDVLIIKDRSHEAAHKHFQESFTTSHQRYLVLITRDDRNTSVIRGNILDVTSFDLTKDPDITDVAARTLQLSFHSLCDCYDSASSLAELDANLKDRLRL